MQRGICLEVHNDIMASGIRIPVIMALRFSLLYCVLKYSN